MTSRARSAPHRRSDRLILAAAFAAYTLAAGSSTALAQVLSSSAQPTAAAPGTQPPPAPQPAPPRAIAAQDGFAIESENGDFRLQIGLLVHADGRFAP